MADGGWQYKQLSVASLQLDTKNPRLSRDAKTMSPKDLIRHLFDHDDAMKVATSIAVRGYFPNEPLLAIKEDGHYIVVEGNRRLAALKALKQPGILEGPEERQLVRLRRQLNPAQIVKVPVIVAPSRRDTDQQVAGRHVGTQVLPWQAENRASFILSKIDEGYDADELSDSLGFTATDVQEAKQTRAIADVIRSLDLPDEIKAKLDNRNGGVLTTVERVIVSAPGRRYLHTQPDPEHGFRGTTTPEAFRSLATTVVLDIAEGRQNSRSLNKNEEIEAYLKSISPAKLPSGSFIPSEITASASHAPAQPQMPEPAPRNRRSAKAPSVMVIPPDFKPRIRNPRLAEIHRELTGLDRFKFSNAGAVLLRVFFELMVVDYFKRTGEYQAIVENLRKKGALQHDMPQIGQLLPDVIRFAKASLPRDEALQVEKVVRLDRSARFNVSDLHGFVHRATDLPTDEDLQQFWLRSEPLFRLMLEDK